ncbi:MAG: hypothetical protein R3C39_15050 [Dehalococcoidia bacterium]
MINVKRRLGVLALVGLGLLAAPAAAMAQDVATSLSFNEPIVEEGDQAVTVAEASHSEPFFIVVHEGTIAQFGAVIGNTDLLDAGTHTNVPVDVNRALVNHEYVWPMLHTDGNGNGVYDDPATDPPVTDADAGNAQINDVVAFPGQVTVFDPNATPTTGSTPFTGEAPGTGSIGLLVASRATDATGLAGALNDAGCPVISLAIIQDGQWGIYIVGAPEMVNGTFPATVEANTAFFVLCGF